MVVVVDVEDDVEDMEAAAARTSPGFWLRESVLSKAMADRSRYIPRPTRTNREESPRELISWLITELMVFEGVVPLVFQVTRTHTVRQVLVSRKRKRSCFSREEEIQNHKGKKGVNTRAPVFCTFCVLKSRKGGAKDKESDGKGWDGGRKGVEGRGKRVRRRKGKEGKERRSEEGRKEGRKEGGGGGGDGGKFWMGKG